SLKEPQCESALRDRRARNVEPLPVKLEECIPQTADGTSVAGIKQPVAALPVAVGVDSPAQHSRFRSADQEQRVSRSLEFLRDDFLYVRHAAQSSDGERRRNRDGSPLTVPPGGLKCSAARIFARDERHA